MRSVLFLIVLAVALAILQMACTAVQIAAYARYLPPKLGSARYLAAGSNNGILDLPTQLLRLEACGAVVFELAPDAIDAVRRDGLAFLEDATQGTAPSLRYAPWRRTPAPKEWYGDGAVASSFHCANLGRSFRRMIGEGSRGPGGFYTTMADGQLFLLPDEGILAVTYQ